MFAAVLVAVQQMALVACMTADILLIPCNDLAFLAIVAFLSQGLMSSLFSLVVVMVHYFTLVTPLMLT
jgi:hypothetical protein